MGQLDDVQAFVERSRKARSLKELDALLDAMTHEIGFDYYALVQHVDVRRSSNRETVWLGNYPPTWIEVFEARGLYATDPIHVASHRTNAGFLWSEVDKLIRLNTHHRRVLGEASKEGLGDGYTVPAHVPGESNGTCSFAMRLGRDLPRENFMVAQLVGTFAMDAGRRLARSAREGLAKKPKLTPRQLDCVLLVARGKSDWEVGQILGISEGTAREYIKEACAQYDVHRRIQLVVRTLHDGQLILSDVVG